VTFSWEDFDNDPPLTPVHRRYLEEFDAFLHAHRDPESQEARRRGMRNLVQLMRHDRPGWPDD
jgi:hypothetical protein